MTKALKQHTTNLENRFIIGKIKNFIINSQTEVYGNCSEFYERNLQIRKFLIRRHFKLHAYASI